MNPAELLARYEVLSTLTERMGDAAARGEWEQLVEYEQQRSAVLAEIMAADAAVRLSPTDLEARAAHIRRVQSHEEAIRRQVQEHMAQIQLHLASNQNTLRLRRAYGV